jgi:DNA adenine methylase
MYSNKLYTPLRYPGGKARFAPFVRSVLEANNLVGGHYLEPYAGGAGVALELLFDGAVEAVHINDADPAIRDFWLAATTKTDQMVDLVENCKVDMIAWDHWRNVMLGVQKGSLVERGFATLFMNRTNRSGILKAGVIGGKGQSGEYKLDARFMRVAMCERLRRIGKFASAIHVYGEDALSLLRKCKTLLPKRSLAYLDPPYYVKGQGLYRNFYGHDDHVRIAAYLRSKSFTRSWMVSYDDVPEIREMYGDSRDTAYGLHYTAQRRYVGAEVMFFSERLVVPANLPTARAA